MSEQWQGLHNPNQHKRYKDECRCVGCGDYEWCASEYPCRCCLAAEVERLTAALAEREVCPDHHRDTPDPEPETGEIVTLCHHGLDAADCPEHGHTLDDHCPVCFGCCGGFPVPEIECCGRGPACGACDDPEPVPQCGATFNEHRCTLDKDHEGWHQEWVERLVDTATWQDAPEVPEWRALVDAVDLLKGYQYSTPLAADEDGLPECQNGDCRCTVHSMGGGDTGLPIGEAVTGEWTRCHDQACIRECEEGCCSGVISALTIERDVLREKVQRVERLLDRCDQDTYDFHWGEGSPVVLTQYVRDALDGGEPDE